MDFGDYFEITTKVLYISYYYLLIMEKTIEKCLKISEEAHKMLCEYGNKGETFDEIIKRLISNVKKQK